ncbi:MAG: hypothetical protein SGCHY_000210 [Lobulomycetales sp.]
MELLLDIDVAAVAADSSLDLAAKRCKIQQQLLRCSSNNDLDSLNRILCLAQSSGSDKQDSLVDLDCVDEVDGSTPLIVATCFGHVSAGADIEGRDAKGWTALFWAITNGHDECVKILVAAGANINAKSSSGRSIKEMARKSSKRLCALLHGTAAAHDTSASSTLYEDEISDDDNDDSFDSLESLNDADSLEEGIPFDWEKCSCDQMFVFNPDASPFIVNVLVNKLRPPRSAKRIVPKGANIIFLCLRYSHYYASQDIMRAFFDLCIEQIVNAVQVNRHDIPFVCYWIKNAFVLLNYLKKDAGLMSATIDFQCTLNELIQSLCAICIKDMEGKIFPVLEDGILDYQSVDAVDVKYESVLHGMSRSTTGFFNWSTSTLRDGLGTRGTRPDASPKTVLAILSACLDTLHRFHVPEALIYQIFDQTFYFLNASIFNRIILSRQYCSRAKGIAIRLNLSDIQGWIRENFCSRESILKSLNPAIQLTQFLQVCTSVMDVASFSETVLGLGGLTAAQMLAVIGNYHYEVDEASVPDCVVQHLEKQDQQQKEESAGNVVPVTLDLRFVLPFQVPKLAPDEDVGRPYLSADIIASLDFKEE